MLRAFSSSTAERFQAEKASGPPCSTHTAATHMPPKGWPPVSRQPPQAVFCGQTVQQSEPQMDRIIKFSSLFQGMFCGVLKECRRFGPVLDAPVFKVPFVHVVVAFVVHIIEDAVLQDEVGGEIVD